MTSLLDIILGWFGRRKEVPPPSYQQNTGMVTSEMITPDITSPAQSPQLFAEDQTINSAESGPDNLNDAGSESSDSSSSDSGYDFGGYDSGGGWDSGGGGGWS